MKYFISSMGFRSKNVTSILNKNLLLLKKNISNSTTRTLLLKTRGELERHRQHL